MSSGSSYAHNKRRTNGGGGGGGGGGGVGGVGVYDILYTLCNMKIY